MIDAKVLLLKVINNGSSPQNDFIKNKRIKLSNQIYLTVLLYYIPFAILNIFFQNYVILALNSINFLIAVFCLYLTGKKKIELSNAVFLHSLIGGILFYGIMLGGQSRIDVLLIAIVSGVYTIYGGGKIKQVIYYIGLCLMTYVAIHTVKGIHVFSGVDIGTYYLSLIDIISFMVSVVACTLIPVLFDIENKRREKQISKSKEATELLLEKKTRFFSMVSHEIRTPLHGIIGLSELLTETKFLPKGVKEKLSVINFSARNLKNIVSDILDFSKLEHGRLTISKDSFNLHNLIKNIDSVQAMRVREKGLVFNKSISFGLPEFVDSDPFRLTQVLNNLIDNAIKFTDKGSVSLNVLFESKTEYFGNLTFEIVDTGVGIALDAQEGLFSAYTQVSPVATRNFDGTGLGLAICKNIISQLDGDIELRSSLNTGTSVKFVLPVKVYHPEVVDRVEPLIDNFDLKALRGLKILQVEDNLINQYVCEEVFKSLGINYKIVTDGIDAIGLLQTEKFDMVIMDYHMPGMDGYEVSDEIRVQENELRLSETPILIATADSEGSKKSNYIKYGINGHIVKPFSKKELFETLRSYCDEFGIETNQMNVKSYFDHLHFVGPQIDLDFVKGIVGDDDATITELISMVRKSIPKYIDGINRYKFEGINSENEREEFITKVHNLKSNFRNVGAKNFAETLQIAEDCLHQENDEGIVWEAIMLIEKNLELFEITKG